MTRSPKQLAGGTGSGTPNRSDRQAAVVAKSLTVAAGSGVTIVAIVGAASQSLLTEATARFAIAAFVVIIVAALIVAGAYALRRS